MSVKIIFLVPYPPGESPSQRFRFEQYFEILTQQGHYYKVQSFLNSKNWQVFFTTGHGLMKLWTLLSGFAKRIFILFQVPAYDFVFIHRETTPIGPPVIEWIIAKILRRKIIYDFDDAIWLTDRRNESMIERVLKWRRKVASICKWAYRVSCGNMYLCEYAKQFNESVIYNPTTIDTVAQHNPDLYPKIQQRQTITIGWTGSHSTLKYLHSIEAVLEKILQNNLVKFMVIADRAPNLVIPFEFVYWNATSEIEDLLKIDIGIMPLPDDEWAKGKCGFKALQYMALNIPSVISPVGVNKTIIDHGIDGFLAHTPEEWFQCLTQLISDVELRKKMGFSSRRKIISRYSVSSNASTFLSLFE